MLFCQLSDILLVFSLRLQTKLGLIYTYLALIHMQVSTILIEEVADLAIKSRIALNAFGKHDSQR